MSRTPPRLLIFDSGLGGLSIYREIVRLHPYAAYLYIADDEVFPYGNLDADVLITRVELVLEEAIARFQPDIVVIACSTASTLVLPPLRERWPQIAFVGTVPAIKPAALQTQTGLISVLATPGTVARDYTRELIESFAANCDVTLIGSQKLASIAECHMRGQILSDNQILQEIEPCFVEKGVQRTDVIVLACTHYPLLLDVFTRLAPWPVTFIDPAEAIARRVSTLVTQADYDQDKGHLPPPAPQFHFTSQARLEPELSLFLTNYGFSYPEYRSLCP